MKNGRNWLPEVFSVFFLSLFLSSTVTGRISRVSRPSPPVCVSQHSESVFALVRVSGPFCSSGGLSDIKEDVHLGDVAHIRRGAGRRTNNNKLCKRLCRRIHGRPVVDSASSSVSLAPLSVLFLLLVYGLLFPSVRHILSTDTVP